MVMGIGVGRAFTAHAQAEPPAEPQGEAPACRPLHPGGDAWSLQDRRRARTCLIEQLQAPDQAHRLTAGQRSWVLAADTLVSTSVPRFGASVARWHGYFVADLLASARPVKGLDITLNLVPYQATASSGYRADTGVLPGLAGHWSGDLFEVGGSPVRGDLQALDLGEITIGRGLLFEREWFEGGLGRLTWRDLSFEFFIAGQTWGLADDLFATTLRWGETGPTLTWLMWPQFAFERVPHFLSLSADLPGLGPHLRLGAELALRLPSLNGDAALGGLLRADWLAAPTRTGRWDLHLGYQLRVYRQGLTPFADRPFVPSHYSPLPWLDDTYVTHASEYVPVSAWYHQISHTVMAEGRVRLTEKFGLQAEVEGRVWLLDDPTAYPRPLSRPTSEAGADVGPFLPEPQIDVYYRGWLTLHPFRDRPYRLRAGLANVFASWGQPASSRLEKRGPFVTFDMEVPL